MKKLYFLFFLLLSVTMFAQTYTFTVYNTGNSGIAANNVNDFKQSSTGTLWIATNNGLSAMVGNNFTNYTTSNSAIATNLLNKIAVSGTNVWATTYQEGLVYRNGTTGAFSHYTMSNSAIPTNMPTDIATDSQGNLWMASTSGLTKFNGTTWTTYNTSNTPALGSNNIKSVYVDAGNNVWLSAGGMLLKFNGITFTPINDQVEKILKVIGNTIYVATGDGFGKIVGTDYTDMYWTDSSCLASCSVGALGVDETNKVWLGLDYCGNYMGGIQNFTNCTTYTTSNSGLPDGSITSIHVIDSNVIWAGTLEGGLVKMNKTDAPPACNPPAGLTLNTQQISATNALVQWTAPTPAPAGYLYVYNTVNTIGGTDGYTTDTAAWFTDLTSNTTYYWWVASDCQPQQWVPGGSFTTPGGTSTCNPPTNLSVNEFELTPTSVNLQWDAAIPSPSGYLYVYNTENTIGGDDGYTQGNAAWIEGLTPNTTYYWWVASDCDPQQWVPGGSFTTPPAALGCFKEISTRMGHNLGIKEDGTLWAWGSNSYGQLGTGTGNQNAPKQVGTDTNWKSIAAGFNYSIALKTDGTIWGWGYNANGRIGHGGSTTANTTQPIQIGTANNWKSIAVGEKHTVALKTNGTLWTWGYNLFGQLGNGTTDDVLTPTQIGTVTNWESIYPGGSHTFAMKQDGTLWGWGYNVFGQLGLGDNNYRYLPVQIPVTNIKTIHSGGYHTLVVKTDGSLWAWGRNTEGQLGDGTNTDRNAPVRIGTANNWVSASTGFMHSFAIRSDDALLTWGLNDYGQLGHGTTIDKNTPTYINSWGWKTVVGGYQHTIAISSSMGALRACGNNDSGQLGNGTNTQSNVLVFIDCPQSALSTPDFEVSAKLQLYPNPVKDILNISFDKEIGGVSVYNLLGQEVITKPINTTNGSIDVSNLSSGTYLVKISSGGQVKTSKFIKK